MSDAINELLRMMERRRRYNRLKMRENFTPTVGGGGLSYGEAMFVKSYEEEMRLLQPSPPGKTRTKRSIRKRRRMRNGRRERKK